MVLNIQNFKAQWLSDSNPSLKKGMCGQLDLRENIFSSKKCFTSKHDFIAYTKFNLNKYRIY